jgi:hypothetical protein
MRVSEQLFKLHRIEIRPGSQGAMPPVQGLQFQHQVRRFHRQMFQSEVRPRLARRRRRGKLRQPHREHRLGERRRAPAVVGASSLLISFYYKRDK